MTGKVISRVALHSVDDLTGKQNELLCAILAEMRLMNARQESVYETGITIADIEQD